MLRLPMADKLLGGRPDELCTERVWLVNGMLTRRAGGRRGWSVMSVWCVLDGSVPGGVHHGPGGWPSSLAPNKLDSGHDINTTVDEIVVLTS